MRSVGVVVDPPFFDQPAGGRQAAEQVLVEAFVTESTVQALDEAVLHRLARRDVVPLDPAIFLPLQDRMRGQLRAVVADDDVGRPRRAMSASSSRATRRPESEVSRLSRITAEGKDALLTCSKPWMSVRGQARVRADWVQPLALKDV